MGVKVTTKQREALQLLAVHPNGLRYSNTTSKPKAMIYHATADRLINAGLARRTWTPGLTLVFITDKGKALLEALGHGLSR